MFLDRCWTCFKPCWTWFAPNEASVASRVRRFGLGYVWCCVRFGFLAVCFRGIEIALLTLCCHSKQTRFYACMCVHVYVSALCKRMCGVVWVCVGDVFLCTAERGERSEPSEAFGQAEIALKRFVN